ncbi:murein L,D-transpeptidase family protein [Verrucomicrobiaceae bacterium 227]
MPRLTRFIILSLVIAAAWFILGRMSSGAKEDGLDLSPEEYAIGSKRERAVAEKVTPTLKEEVAEMGLKWGTPVFIRAFKQERVLELWLQKKDRKFELFRTYPIAAASGELGPKLKEGDRQVPEGFYFVPPSRMNPQSDFHLSFNIGYPNPYDLAHDRTGTYIMVHGSNISVGCLAMTDEKIEEIYTLCDAAHQNGQKFFRIHIFPFRMTNDEMTKHRENPWFSFWLNLQTGFQWFEERKIPPSVSVRDLTYQFQ